MILMSIDDLRRPCATIGCPNHILEHAPTAPFCSRCHSQRAQAAAMLVTATGLVAGDPMDVEVGGGWVRRPCEEDGLLIARGEHQIFVPADQAEEALQAIGRCLPLVPSGANGVPDAGTDPELPAS